MSIPAFAATPAEELKITVANDLHYNGTYTSLANVRKHNSISEDFYHISSTGKLVYESYAIIVSFLEQAAKNDSDIVLLPGDIVDVGTVKEHEVMTAILAEFEATSGKSVYVVPGNHDLFQTSVAEFMELYEDFGYGEALAVDGGQSLESIVATFGKTLPETEYADLIDLFVTMYVDYQAGIENYPAYSNEMIIVTRGLAAVLTYALKDVSPEDYAVVLDFLFGLLDVKIPSQLLAFTGNAISNFENLEIIISTALIPTLANMSTDTAPADNGVTLAGYGTRGENLSFFDRVKEFFKSIIDFFRSLLALFF